MNESVRDSYDRIAEVYAAQRDQFESVPHLERFSEFLVPGARVLDVGCGAGLPVDRFLAGRGYRVHGIDLSSRMIELARQNVTEASFEVRDMLSLRDHEHAVDGIVSFYAIFHVPRDEHARLFQCFRSFLQAGAPLLVTMAGSDWEGSESDFHGVEMWWSHYGPKRNRELVELAGFEVLRDEIDQSGDERHQVLLAAAR